MQREIVDFINSQRICVLALEMQDGSPHGSTVHFAFDEKSSTFFFETYNIYRKGEVLLQKEKVRASIVIGFDEKVMKTLQIDGEARIITDEEKELFENVYIGKFPEKKEKSADKKFVKFSFTPTWWRYTDFKSSSGKLIINSEDK